MPNADEKPQNQQEVDDSAFLSGDNDHQEAKTRYTEWRSKDPFPSVKPALLHSGQIRDYILTTGMISPFTREDLKNLKPASLEIALEGRVVYWDDNLQKVDILLSTEPKKGTRKKFTLPRNSIAFVQVKPRFQLPDYIAIRFNLKITHVYRGLLLGTGPLVDPGYQGHLYIPLHNLTNNDYDFEAGEGLLWMEFTKLQWGAGRPENFVPFPTDKINQDLDYFFAKANDNGSIASSIPQDILKAREASEAAASRVKWLSNLGTIALIAAFISLLALSVNLINLCRSTSELTYKVSEEMRLKLQQLEKGHDILQTRLETASKEINAPMKLVTETKQEVGSKLQQLENDRDAIRVQLEAVSKQLDALSQSFQKNQASGAKSQRPSQ